MYGDSVNGAKEEPSKVKTTVETSPDAAAAAVMISPSRRMVLSAGEVIVTPKASSIMGMSEVAVAD